MKKILIILCSLSFTVNVYAAEQVCPGFPFFQPQTGSLAVTNCDFHQAYESRIEQIQNTFGAVQGRPVIMNLGGNLVLKYNGKTETVEITPLDYHYIKSYSHIVFAVYLLLSQDQSGILTSSTISKLQKLQNDVQQAMVMLPTLQLHHKTKIAIANLMNFTNDFINKILLQRSWKRAEIKKYYRHIMPALHAAMLDATKIELHTLDRVMTKWLNAMKPEEINKLGIVVAVPHQPRAQEVSLQYFAKRFGYRFGVGALHENGLLVMEGQYDEKSAYALLARHYLDREIAQIMFGDPEYLQRDLLANAAKEILS